MVISVLCWTIRRPLVLLIVALTAVVAVVGWRVGRGTRDPASTGLAVALAFSAPVGIVVYSLVSGRSIVLPRNLISSLPGLLVLASAAIMSVLLRLPRFAAAAVLVVVLGAGGFHTVLSSDYARSAYSQAAGYIDRHAPPGEVVFDYPVFPRRPVNQQVPIYLRREHRYHQVALTAIPQVAGWLARADESRAVLTESCPTVHTCADPLPGAAA
ncbi:MAG: hypothetical protein ACXVRH_04280, partial [Thermoleophilaceae bacterium]